MELVGTELGCQIIHQEKGLCESILEQIEGTEFVSLAVDDMMYFRESSFAKATGLLTIDPNICLWSWRIGPDLIFHADLEPGWPGYWIVEHAKAPMPYSYIFHTDGSVFRSKDLEYWIKLMPGSDRYGPPEWNLNHLEAYMALMIRQAREHRGPPLQVGRLHAGPRKQTCICWALNKVTCYGSAAYHEIQETTTEHLRAAFEEGARLDYSSLYEQTDWIAHCGAPVPCHVPATPEAARLFDSLVRIPC